jgi:uncharacterized membrane protein YhiD involved in acid resistance
MQRSKLVVVTAVAAAIVLTIALYLSRDSLTADTNTTPARSTAANSAANSTADSDNPFVQMMQGGGGAAPSVAEPAVRKSWAEELLSILFRLFLAVVLSGILAFRPRKDVSLFRRSLFVSQTQILLAVVAAALMMIVGDNTARAFAIFAAVSLVRFRTNIRDPKEITVLLISLALGLAAGVGRWDLGIALCFFALALLWLLEFNEGEQVYRSMELCIKTRDTERAKNSLQKLFKRYKIDAEVRGYDPPDEKNPIGELTYYITLRLNLSTDRLSEQILRMDPDNIEGIEWSQKKGASSIYQ